MAVAPILLNGFSFDRERLDAIVAKTLPHIPSDKTFMLGAGVDNNGAAVAVLFQRDTDTWDWQARFAAAVSPTDKLFGASFTVSR